MTSVWTAPLLALSLLASAGPAALAQMPAEAGLELGVSIPASSLAMPADHGVRAHTNVRRLVLARTVTPATAPSAGVYYETPSSLACIYGLIKRVAGCNPQTLAAVPKGGSKAVAIVDAYDDPTALSDLQAYSAQFGLPAVTAASLQVIYSSGSQPAFNSGWQAEEAIDTQMVHALAPHATIYLVEAASNLYSDLLAAESVAAQLVAAAGGGEVSNSWGGTEFSAETDDFYAAPFAGASVVFFASTGDTQYTSYPAVLPNVVAVGGTSVARDPATGAYQHEVSWSSAGSGPSAFVPRPAFQAAIPQLAAGARGTPDIAAVANPQTGVWVLIAGSWEVYGGTSVAAPVVAAITNAAGHFTASTGSELAAIYGNLGTADFHDVTLGTCGLYQFYAAAKRWDFCTGVGSPANLLGE